MSSEHVEVLERLRGVLEHGKMGDKCLIAPDLVTAAIASLSAPQSGGAESKLAEAGVFAGHHGLRGLADAAEFWEKQPYGTRLYYGDGGMDYLHRGVLQKAVEILDAAQQPPAEAQPDYCGDHKRHVWGCRPCEEAAGKFNEPAEAQPVAPDDAEVICPGCAHQFRAIPVQVQRDMLAAGFEPPFLAPPSAPVGEAAMEAWSTALNDAGELRSNAPDERYERRAQNVEAWIKANRPEAPSAPVGAEHCPMCKFTMSGLGKCINCEAAQPPRSARGGGRG